MNVFIFEIFLLTNNKVYFISYSKNIYENKLHIFNIKSENGFYFLNIMDSCLSATVTDYYNINTGAFFYASMTFYASQYNQDDFQINYDH